MNKFRLLTTCTYAKASDLEEMYATQREVCYRTVLRRIGKEHLLEVFPVYKLGIPSMSKDRYIRYYRCRYMGVPCYNIEWSCIDHIFT
jgi:hypothetical protein